MFKFATNKLTRKQPEENETRRRLQKDLFSFSKIADKGFPSKPSAIDFDKKLKLLAIGTKNGDIRIYGSPGVQISCYQDVPFPIQKLLFIQGTGQLISLVERINRDTNANKVDITYHLILWQLVPHKSHDSNNWSNVEKIKEYQIEQKLGRISAISLLNDNSYLFIGFESGDTYVFNVTKFEIVPGVINKDFIVKKLPENMKKNPGSVESICQHPKNSTKLLLAFNRGLFVIFDFSKNVIDLIKSTNQQLESACFFQSGDYVSTSHSDGSFLLWDIENKDAKPITQNVYGPYPCRPITKIMVKTVKNNDPFYIFAGGVPRASYMDKISISVMQGEKNHVAFDFTSKIIDFLTIDRPTIDSTTGQINDNPCALIVLLEEEFIAIDLLSENWPQHRLPYLYSVHSSAIICTHYCNNVSLKFYNKLKNVGNLYQEELSDREWPIKSNQQIQINQEQNEQRDLLLTGHEDGSVRFWDVTNMSMTLLYRLKSADYFQTDSAPPDELDEENWPPFRKVGTFDPYSDDPKLGIQKIILCAQREILVIAGTAGQVLVMSLNDDYRDIQLQVNKINIVTDMDNFIWKGHDPLTIRETCKLTPGYQPLTIIQLYPPATISALCLNTDWRLISMGTSHGFALFDYVQMKELLVRCTLDPAYLAAQQDGAPNSAAGAISRRKSLKKSLRESFRKLRRGRSQKTIKKESKQIEPGSMRVEHINDDMDHRPIERQVESREFKQMDDIPPSVIRYIYFVRTYITNTTTLTNSLWVGTNTGVIYIYALHIPERANRQTAQIQCVLAKEMRLKHRAPVVHIQVIDKNNSPLPESLLNDNQAQLSSTNQQNSSTLDDPHVSNHKVIICSEEQFKVFQLPTLKPYCKFKLTAIEGARVRRIAYNKYLSKSDSTYSEYCLSCLTNLGDLSVYSLPNLKRQVQTQCMKQQDINAITSFVFSKFGQAFYLQSPSEFVHISMSACDTLTNKSIENNDNQQASSSNRQKSKSKSPSSESRKVPPASSSSIINETSPPRSQMPVPAPRNTPRNENTPLKLTTDTKLEELSLNETKSTPNTQHGVIEMNDSSSFMNATDLSLSSHALNAHLSTNNANASSSGVSSAFTGSDLSGVDISMDSVVDRFNEDYNNISSKIQPINEENSNITCSLITTTNTHNPTSTNNASSSEELTQSSPDLQSSESSSTVDDQQKSSTNDLSYELKPIPAKRHNLHANEQNKIEQVTKRIENNNKLEYRETAID